MAELTTDNAKFGIHPCPATLAKRVDFNREIDTEMTPMVSGTNYELIPIPKGFVIEFVGLEQVGYAGAAAAITAKLKSDSSTLGAALTTATGATPRTFAQADATNKSAKYCDAGDIVCVVSGAALVSGKIRVHIIGYQAFGESLLDVPEGVDWQKGTEQTTENVSAGDPAFRQ